MSTSYRSLKKIRFAELFDGRLARFDIQERVVEGMTDQSRRVLTDGRNWLLFFADEDGFLGRIERRGLNSGRPIGEAIMEVFETRIVSERQPEYWGCETQEELDAMWKEHADRQKEEFYRQLIEHLEGGADPFPPGTIGSIQAEIARKLVAERPELTSIDRKEELLQAVNDAFEKDHVIKVTLPKEKVEEITRIMTVNSDRSLW